MAPTKETVMEKEEVKRELEQAQAHLEQAVGHVRELGQLWKKEGTELGKRALDLASDSLRQAAAAVDDLKSKLK
jgi:predicted translin family RNA/ssDNA-binding protein